MTSAQKQIIIKDIIQLIDTKKLSKTISELLKVNPSLARKLINFEKKYTELKLKAAKTMSKSELNNMIKQLEQYV